jgi:hypothetical protein
MSLAPQSTHVTLMWSPLGMNKRTGAPQHAYSVQHLKPHEHSSQHRLTEHIVPYQGNRAGLRSQARVDTARGLSTLVFDDSYEVLAEKGHDVDMWTV